MDPGICPAAAVPPGVCWALPWLITCGDLGIDCPMFFGGDFTCSVSAPQKSFYIWMGLYFTTIETFEVFLGISDQADIQQIATTVWRWGIVLVSWDVYIFFPQTTSSFICHISFNRWIVFRLVSLEIKSDTEKGKMMVFRLGCQRPHVRRGTAGEKKKGCYISLQLSNHVKIRRREKMKQRTHLHLPQKRIFR
jgi:hypothetical protein